AFKTLDGTTGGALASIQKGTKGAAPGYWSNGSINAMNTNDFGIPSFSKAHWKAGDRVLVTSVGNGASAQLAWFDLEASNANQGTAYDFLTRDGDSGGAIMPSFSHDGKTVVYMSTNSSVDGRPQDGSGDLYTVPYGNRKGGQATPVMGASESAYTEYYPAF